MEQITNNYLFGLLLCILFFYVFSTVKNNTKQSWINPLFFSGIAIIAILTLGDIPYKHFKLGGDIIHAFLTPVTIILALPLYRQRKLIAKYKYSIIGGVFAGVLTSIFSVLIMSEWFGMKDELGRSLLAHSVTTPIGISINSMLGANEGMTIAAIVITGVLGVVLIPLVLKLFRIKHPIAIGLAIGTSTHALGTSKAMEIGDTEGAISGLAIGITALTTTVVIVVMQFLELI